MPIENRKMRMIARAAIAADRKSRKKKGRIARETARMGARPWTKALTTVAKRKASRCSSLRRASIARSIVRMSSFFSTRSTSNAPTALLTARAIPAPMEEEMRRGLSLSDAPNAKAAVITPRIVNAPSNEAVTKYRRRMGPRFVISLYSRILRRQARRSMSSALDPEGLANDFFQLGRSGPRLLDVREAGLGEVRLPAPLPAEFGRDLPNEFRRIQGYLGTASEDELHIARRGSPVDSDRPWFGRRCL